MNTPQHIITIVGLGVTLCAASLSGETRRVPQDYATIQAALDAAADGDTVLVSSGTYAEELWAPPVRFWLMGDVEADSGDFERPTVDPSSLDSALWRRCLTIPVGCQPTIERMKFISRAAMFPRAEPDGWTGIVVHSNLPVTLRFCAFDSTMGALVYQPPPDAPSRFSVEDCRFTHGLRRQVASEGRAVVQRCVFLACRYAGFVTGRDSTVIEDCVFSGDSAYTGFWLSGDNLAVRDNIIGPMDTCTTRVFLVQDARNCVIEGNLFHDIHIVSSHFLCLFNADSTPVRVRRNQFINLRALVGGLAFAFSTQSPASPLVAEIDSNLFWNTVADCTGAAAKAFSAGNAMSVTGNRFIDLSPSSVACINAQHSDSGCASRFRYNIFQAGDYAISSPGDEEDAVLNYWGDASGPYNATFNPEGLGARVDDPVWFDPWCLDTNCVESAPETPSILHPTSFVLSAYPNPFNSTLHLALIPAQAGIVKLELYDVLGRRAEEIWHGPIALQKDITFDASALASGIYFARVTDVISRKNLAMTKLVLLK